MTAIPVIDLFAGPGGLGEGFSSVVDEKSESTFQIVLSIEKDPQAHKTLRLRSYLRKILNEDGTVPSEYLRYMQEPDSHQLQSLVRAYPEAWRAACEETLCEELREHDDTLIDLARERLRAHNARTSDADLGQPWVLIGGPPCQAYSVVGRSRRSHDLAGLESDPKQTLYKCYLEFIRELRPTAFVMENVKGLLSAKHRGDQVFSRIIEDMEDAGYTIHSLVKEEANDPHDYVVRSEEFGIPQARHRVILLGIHKRSYQTIGTLKPSPMQTVRDALSGLPKIRSDFSIRSGTARENDWSNYVHTAAENLLKSNDYPFLNPTLDRVRKQDSPKYTGADRIDRSCTKSDKWYRRRLANNQTVANHVARKHMPADLDRYLFCAAYAEARGVSPKLQDFPARLLPSHKNAAAAADGMPVGFSDRFRVQIYDRYSTTVTAHIAKDGHYYIHPDPTQCRSLTVREAARLQTFPDDYIFEGNRTAQYTQVGNAVPPKLAEQIADLLAAYFRRDELLHSSE